MLLRPRQELFVSRVDKALAERGNTLGVAPTGAGKTVMLSAVVRDQIGGGQRALILQHRDELVDQNRRTFHLVSGGARSGIVDGKIKDWHHPITFAMVQTLARDNNLAAMPRMDLIVRDEAHHVAARSDLLIVERARELNPECRVLGVTATANRGDRKSLRKVFDNVADQITLREMIEAGVLVRPRTFVVDLGVTEDLRKVRRTAADFDMAEVSKIMNIRALNNQVVEKWREVAGDRQTVAFCSTVEHAQGVVTAFHAAGVSCGMVDGDMAAGARRDTLAAYDCGEFRVLVNVAVLTEGWDCQPVSCVLLLRPSSHASTMIQMIGRGLRRLDAERYPGRRKDDCIIIDFGTSVLTHGSLEQDIELDPVKGKAPTKDCPQCASTLPFGSRACAICGFEFPAHEAQDLGGLLAGEQKPAEFVLTEVDILKTSPFRWEDLWDGAAMVATAFEAWATVVYYGDCWHAIGGGNGRGMVALSNGDKMLCLAAADDWMREHGDRTAARKSKSWLNMAASPKQLQTLRLDPQAAIGLTRYQAACHLTWKFNERGIRAKLEASVYRRAA